MKWMLINGEYDGANNILLYCRNEKGDKDVIKVLGFDPYFYVPSGEMAEDFSIISQSPSELKSIYGDELDKVVTRQPRDVKEMRAKFSKHFEADIPFVRRFLVDTNIYSGFSLPEDKKMVHWDQIKPEEAIFEPRSIFLDIETFTLGRFPKPTDKNAKTTINCLYDSRTGSYLSLAVDPKPRKERVVWELASDHKAIIVPHERDLLELTKQFFEVTDPDIITAWYLPFDKEFLEERLKIVKNQQFNWERTNLFDLLDAYKHLYQKVVIHLKM